MLSGLQFSTDFVRLHTTGRLTIEEMAYMTREAFGERAPYRTWLNQWGREPTRALPSLPAEVRLHHPNELIGLDVRDLETDDDRRIDVGDTLCIKLNGHVYRISTELLDTAAPQATAAPPAALPVLTRS